MKITIIMLLVASFMSSVPTFAKSPSGICGKLEKQGDNFFLSHEGNPDDVFEKSANREVDRLIKKKKTVSLGKCYLMIGEVTDKDDDGSTYHHVKEIGPECPCF